MVKTIEVCDMPVRAAKFIARKNWLITGSDDLVVRVYNYNTLEKVMQFDAHSDYIRNFAVHPSRPYVLSCSDDMTVKLWDWERGWKCINTFEGHAHYVMAVVINPKDSNTFATASLDRTVKVWSFGSVTANYTLEGHEKGVNCVDYYGGGDRPYLASGADDTTIRVWDYQNKACVRVLEGHVQNVSSVVFHRDLPIIVSGSEDGAVKIWNANSFRSETTFNFSMDRVWSLAVRQGSTEVAVGSDEGAIVFQLGKGEPSASLDGNGKLIWARQNEIMTGNVKQAAEDSPPTDGERIALPSKELGQCEVYPQSLQHSPNGRFVVVCGDGEYIIYTALAWRNKTFGKALELVWAAGSNDYAVRESQSKVVVFQNFSECGVIRMAASCEALFGGVLIGASCAGGQLCFFDWNTCQLVRRIDVDAKRVYWSESSKKAALCTRDALYVLQYNEQAVQGYLEKAGGNLPDDGIEEAFDFFEEFDEKVLSGMWIGECFVFVSENNRISYFVGNQIHQVAIAEKPLYLVGYLPKESRLVLLDKDASVVTFGLSITVMDYKSAILHGDKAAAATLLPSIPADQLEKVAHFLDAQGMKEEALSIASNPELKFDLALHLRKLDVAYDLAVQLELVYKWRELGDLALAEWKIALAEKCFLKSDDFSSLLLLYSSSGNTAGLLGLASLAIEKGQYNVAFSCYFVTGHRDECFDLLVRTNRYPEAALFARTYLPSAVEKAVALWNQHLAQKGHRAANLIANPLANPELFSDFGKALLAEDTLRDSTRIRSVSFESGIVVQDGHPSSLPVCSPYEGAFSDHMSMEVHPGTASMRADDLDDLMSVTVSESRDEPNPPLLRGLEQLSIQELEEEHQQSDSLLYEPPTLEKPEAEDPLGRRQTETAPEEKDAHAQTRGRTDANAGVDLDLDADDGWD